METKCFEVNMFQENCYIVYDSTKEAIIIDPGCYYPEEQESLKRFIESKQLIIKHLINTHLHPDHIFGNAFIEQTYHVITEAHPGDQDWLKNAPKYSQYLGIPWQSGDPVKIGKELTEGTQITFGNNSLDILYVPGHSQGSICFYNKAHHSLFVGDVLFRGSIGRTDLPGGDWNTLVEGIKKKLLLLPEETIVYSGHGPTTTIGNEKKQNPYL